MNTYKETLHSLSSVNFNYPPLLDEPYKAALNEGNFQNFLPWSLMEGLSTDLLHRNFQESRILPIRHRGLDIHLYITPAGQEGFQWRQESTEVFVIQTSGDKEISLRRNVKNPQVKDLNLPESIDFECERLTPEVRYHLKAGEFLFIPAGYWYKARALSNSLSLAIHPVSSFQ